MVQISTSLTSSPPYAIDELHNPHLTSELNYPNVVPTTAAPYDASQSECTSRIASTVAVDRDEKNMKETRSISFTRLLIAHIG